jgi:hypothetical protein
VETNFEAWRPDLTARGVIGADMAGGETQLFAEMNSAIRLLAFCRFFDL